MVTHSETPEGANSAPDIPASAAFPGTVTDARGSWVCSDNYFVSVYESQCLVT